MSDTPEALTELVGKAIDRAWQLGQTYWQQADSESFKQNARSETTRGMYEELRAETLAALRQGAQPAGVGSELVDALNLIFSDEDTDLSPGAQIVLGRAIRAFSLPAPAAMVNIQLFAALKELADAATLVKADLDAAPPKSRPACRNSTRLTWPLSTASMAMKAALAPHPEAPPVQFEGEIDACRREVAAWPEDLQQEARRSSLLQAPFNTNKPTVAAGQGAQPAGEPVANLPLWWPDFIQRICELPDRNSPEDEPEAMVATARELENCALNAIVALAPHPEAPPAQPAGEDLKKHLQAYADSEYCKGVEVLRREQCLGEEYKLAKGIFGQEELEAHREAARHFGAEAGIYHALKTFVPHSEAPPQASTQGAEEFVLVPKEPTQGMVDAGRSVMRNGGLGVVSATYEAMLAAAPQQKKAEGV